VLRPTTSAADGILPAGCAFDAARRRDPQLRQKFMPAVFCVWHDGQVNPTADPPDRCGTGGGGPSPGNPAFATGVDPGDPAATPGANREPQLRQKIDPEGLSRPHEEQRGMVARR